MTPALRDFRALVALADELHFGRAAEAVGMTQPQFSNLIARLEASSGVRIAVRRPRVSLTDAGRILVAASRDVLRATDEGVRRSRLAASGRSGTVRIAFASSVALTTIPQVLQRVQRSHREIDVRLLEMHSGSQVDALRSGAVDLAFGREASRDESLQVRLVLSEPLTAFLPPDHPCAEQDHVDLSRLANERFVLFRREVARTLYDQIAGACLASGFTPDVAQHADEWHSILALVGAGFGVTLGPLCLSDLQPARVVAKPITGSSTHLKLWMTSRQFGLSPAATAVIGAIAEQLPLSRRNVSRYS